MRKITVFVGGGESVLIKDPYDEQTVEVKQIGSFYAGYLYYGPGDGGSNDFYSADSC